MKSILISIKPEWVAKILNGEKTIEIRKTMPKCELPCKVYIYCTKQGRPLVYGDVPCNSGFIEKYTQTYNYSKEDVDKIWGNLQGKVVAEFMLNKVEELEKTILPTIPTCVYLTKTKRFASVVEKIGCLSQNEIYNYLGGKNGYAWYIDNLKIYDKPKELEEFYKQGTYSYSDWLYGYYNGHRGARCNYNSYLNVCRIKKPPQSWCYVEEV